MIKTRSHIISDVILKRIIKNAFNAGHRHAREYMAGNRKDVARRNAIKNARATILKDERKDYL